MSPPPPLYPLALQSIADLCLLSGHLIGSSVFYVSLQFLILHLLLSAYTQFHDLFCRHFLCQLPCGLLLNT
jgi:hypothetical protein